MLVRRRLSSFSGLRSRISRLTPDGAPWLALLLARGFRLLVLEEVNGPMVVVRRPVVDFVTRKPFPPTLTDPDLVPTVNRRGPAFTLLRNLNFMGRM